jgi:hypothetical protein
MCSAQEKRSIGDQNSPRPQGSKPKSPGRLHACINETTRAHYVRDSKATTNTQRDNKSTLKTTPRISHQPAVEPRRRGAAGEPDRPVGVRRGAHGERRPGRLGLSQQRLAAEEGGRRPLPIPGERRDGGGGGRGGGDECHCGRKLWRGGSVVRGARQFKGSRRSGAGLSARG